MKWHLEKRKISELSYHPKNPRKLSKHDAAHLQQSLENFGLCEPIVINTDGMIIGGHQRVKTLKKMEHKEVDVYVPEEPLSANQVDELNIRLNRNAGEFDFDILANEWDMTNLIDWGFNPEEFDMDLSDLAAEEEESEQLSPPENPITMLGDIYDLNDHRLICGDSTSAEVVEKLFNGIKPNLMITDPPYGVNYDPNWRNEAGKGVRSIGKVSNDDQIDWTEAWNLFTGNVAYIWCASWYLPEVAKSLDNCNFERKSLIIWIKQHFALSRGDYHWQHEPCWYAVRKGQSHNWQGSRKEATVWEIANLNCFGKSAEDGEERTAHSTQKPVECMARPIRNNSAESEYVYDPFLGSGSTLIAAEQLNRICYGVELNPAYCDIIVDRWKNYMTKQGKSYTIKKNGLELSNG